MITYKFKNYVLILNVIRFYRKEIMKKSDYALWLPQHVFVWQLVENCLKEDKKDEVETEKESLLLQ